MRKINLIVLILKIEELYNLWCLDVVQAPPRVQARISSTLTSLTLFPMRSQKVCNLSSQTQLGRLNSNNISPQKYSAFNLSNQPNASFYSAVARSYRSTYEGIESSFKGISSSHQGVSSFSYGMHKPQRSELTNSRFPLEASRNNPK